MIKFDWEEDGIDRYFEIPVGSVYSVVIDYVGTMPYTPSRLHVKGAILGYRR